MKKKYLFRIGILLIFCIQNAFAQLPPFNPTKTSIASGNFSDASIWSPAGVPSSIDKVMISPDHTIVLTSNISIESIAIEQRGVLNNSSYSLQLGVDSFSSIYRNQGTHNASSGGKIICSPVFTTEFQGNGMTNCDIEVPASGPKFVNNSSLIINGNISHPTVPNFGINGTAFIEVTNGSHINITGDLLTSPLYTVVIDIFPDSSLMVNGSVTLHGGSETGAGSSINNRGLLSVSQNLHIGDNLGFVFNDTGATLTVGADFLGEGTSSFFFNEMNATAYFGGSVFPSTNDGVLLVTGTSIFTGQPTEPNTIVYNGSFNQAIKMPSGGDDLGGGYLANTYSNLILANNNSKSLTSDIVINGDLSIIDNAQLNVTTTNFNIDINGNWINTSNNINSFDKQLGTVSFTGMDEQSISSVSGDQSFHNLVVNNPSGINLLNTNATISNSLSLLNGIVTTGNGKVIITNPSSNSIIGYNQNKFIYGTLRRFIASNTDNYTFPIGRAATSSAYYKADLLNNNLGGVTYVDASVTSINEAANNIDTNLNTSQGTNQVIDVHSNAIWSLSPNLQPTSGTYGVRLYTQNISGLTDNLFYIIKRPSNSNTYADWDTFSGITTIPANNNPGRTTASGYAERLGYNSFSQFAVSTASEAPINFTITASSDINGTISPNGVTNVNSGSNQTYVFTPSSCYQLASVLVDGINNPDAVINGSFTFSNITANHTISASFAPVNVIVNQPSNPTICKQIGATTSISVIATGASYQWYTQTATGTTWTVVANNANYSGATTATLNITRTTASVPAVGTKYRVVINGGICSNLTSNTVVLQEQTVLSKATAITAKSSTNATLSPANTTCQGSSVNLTLAAGSIGNLQWQSSTDGINYSNVGGVIAQSALSALNPAQTLSSGVLTQDTWFRVVASNGICSSVNGVPTKITVSLPAVTGTISGGDVTVCAFSIGATDLSGSVVPFSNSTTMSINGNNGTVVWQKSTNFTTASPTWATVTTGVVGNQLTVTNLTVDTWYRVLVSNGACKATSPEVKITVSKVAKAGAVTATSNSVVSANVCTGGDITFTSAAYTGTSNQWEVSTTSNITGFAPVSGENGLVFTMNDVSYAPLSKFYVRNVVYSGSCTMAISAVKTITVNPLSVAGTVTGGGTVCVDGGGTLKVAGQTGKIQWEYSTDGVNYLTVPYWKTVAFVPTFFNPNSTTAFTTPSSTGTATSYIVSSLAVNTYFRAKITSGACSSVYTNVVQYLIGTNAVAGTISAGNSTICPGTGTTLTLSGSTGAIQWQKSAVSATTGLPGTFANISGKTTPTLATGNLTASTAYQAVVTIGACSTVTTAYFIVNVVAKPVAKPVTANVTTPAGSLAAPLCTTDASKVLTIGAGYVGAIQWQTSTTTGFSDISGETGTTYTIANPAVGANHYRASFTNSCGTVVYSAAKTVYYQSCEARTDVKVVKTPFAVVAYPNPYSENFSLNLTTTSEESVSVMVYDMTGRLVEKQEVSTAAIAELQVGNRYPSGIYNVIITQGSDVKTLRVVKR